MTETRKIRAAIVGLGKMGISHCAILNSNPNAELESICDSSSLILDAFRKYSDKSVYSDYKKMLDEAPVDALVIATPTKSHFEITKYALRKGVHVFCEKPFSLRVEEGRELVKLAAEAHVVNQVGYHNRFIGTFREAKRLIEAGVVGEIYHFSGEAYGPVVLKEKRGTWRSEREAGGGCLFDYSSHVINLIDYLLGPPLDVKGTMLKSIFSKSVEDAVYSTLTLDNGVSGTLSVNWSDETFRKMATSITVSGKLGKIIVDSQELRIYTKRDVNTERLRKGWNVKYITDVTVPISFYLRGEEYSAQIDYFIQHIADRNLDNVNSFESALRTDSVIDMLIKNSGD